jgi:uncharacterized metal-binding protein YceD (DUF177 family)
LEPRVPFPLVPLEAVPSHGLDIVVDADWARKACAEGLGGTTQSVGGRLQLDRHDRDISLEGPLSGRADVPCDRCGAPVRLDVKVDLRCLYLAPRPESEPEPEADYEELGDYDGVTFDVAEAVREAFVLERPARVLCADFAPAAERETADAACLARFRAASGSTPSVDPRLAALQNFKPEN